MVFELNLNGTKSFYIFCFCNSYVTWFYRTKLAVVGFRNPKPNFYYIAISTFGLLDSNFLSFFIWLYSNNYIFLKDFDREFDFDNLL